MQTSTRTSGTLAKKIYVIDPAAPEQRKLRVAAYARVSSDSSDQIDSYISQVRHYTAVIQENEDWEFVDIYADEGLTGLEAAKRDEFQRMLTDCRKGKIDRILVKSVSRFARNLVDCLAALQELKTLGITVRFDKEGIDTAKPGRGTYLTLHGITAQRESVSHSGNMRHGIQMRMKNGSFVPSSTPYGYVLTDNKLVVQEEQAAVVRRIYFDYLCGKGMHDIADSLNAEGVPLRFGHTRWRSGTICYILTNVTYVGDMLWQKTFTTDTLPFKQVRNTGEKDRYYVEDTHPPIIDRSDFDRVQALVTARREVYYKQKTPGQHLLSKKVFCGECGTLFRRKVTRDTVYWVCRKHNGKKTDCGLPQIPESELMGACVRLYNKLRAHRQEILAPMLEQLQALADKRYRASRKMCDLNKELVELSEQILVLNRLKSKGYIESALFIAQTDEITRKLTATRTAKRKLMEADEDDSLLFHTEMLMELLENGPDNAEELSGELFEDLIERITVNTPEQIKIRLTNGLELTEVVQRTVR